MGGDRGKVKVDLTARYLGLVVVPRKFIVQIELEEFASQMRGREVKVLGLEHQTHIQVQREMQAETETQEAQTETQRTETETQTQQAQTVGGGE